MTYLGLSFETHHHGAALVKEGHVLAAVAEESFSRVKADNDIPLKALRSCLEQANVTPEEITAIGIAGLPPLANILALGNQVRAELLAAGSEGWNVLIYHKGDRQIIECGLTALIKKLALCTGFPQFLYLFLARLHKLRKELPGFRGKICFVDHHLAHLTLPCQMSGLDPCLSIVVEGLDKLNCLSLDIIKNGKLFPLAYSTWPHSPGYFFRFAASMLGFCPQTDGGKVMGLAAYSNGYQKPDFMEKLFWKEDLYARLSPTVHRYRHQFARTGIRPKEFQSLTAPQIAHAFQSQLESVITAIVQDACRKTGLRDVVLSGGVAANVRLNQRIHELPDVDQIFVSPAMGDIGLPLGAALALSVQDGFSMHIADRGHVFYGPRYPERMIEKLLAEKGVPLEPGNESTGRIAQLLAEGQIIARFEDRLEYGPRALGNRSILCRPDRQDLVDRLGRALARPKFMPFAPSILEHAADDCLVGLHGATHSARFMNISFQTTERFRQTASAVVHMDGSVRPSIVGNWNPSFKKLLEEFSRITGLPCLLNTSFNLHGEPTVCTPDDAVRTFLTADIDALSIGSFLASRPKTTITTT